ncbi:MAG: Nif11-like leader peptide family natural product precursor [Prochlorococcus sp.]
MAASELDRFLKAVVDDHSLATGIKPLKSHLEIVAYANSCNFVVTLAEWGRQVAMDGIQLSDPELESVLLTDPNHWTWAFQQVRTWRTLLMEASRAEGKLPAMGIPAQAALVADQPLVNPIPSSGVSDDQATKDLALDQFICLAKENHELLEQIKLAKHEDEVLQLAESKGYIFDSMTMLRKWSQHTDFSKPTWFGWFQ